MIGHIGCWGVGGVGVFICGPVSGISRLKGVLVTLTDCRASKRRMFIFYHLHVDLSSFHKPILIVVAL